MPALSKTSEQCKQCEFYDECDEKRMVLCGLKEIAPHESMVKESCETVQVPLLEDIEVKHDYRNVKIAPNTTVTIDLEDLKKQLEFSHYKGIKNFMNNGA